LFAAFGADIVKKFALTAAFIPVALVPHEAVAADVPAVTSDAWTGFHLGVGAGYDWSKLEVQGSYDYYCIEENFTCTTDFDADSDLNSAIAVVDVGADYQISSNVVVGIGSDFTLGAAADAGFNEGSARYEVEAGNSWSLYSRLGYAFNDRVLGYALAGWTNVEFEQTLRTGDSESQSDSEWLSGLTLGGGLETAITSNVSLKLEYRYTELDGASADLSRTEAVDTILYSEGMSASSDINMQSVRAVISYRF